MNVRPIIDAHLDLAWNALQWNRDLTQPLDAVRAVRVAHDRPPRPRARHGHAAGDAAGRHRRVPGDGARRAPSRDVCPAAGFNRRDLDFRTQAIAYAIGAGPARVLPAARAAGSSSASSARAAICDSTGHAWTAAPQTRAARHHPRDGRADPIVTPRRPRNGSPHGLRCVGMAHYGQGVYAARHRRRRAAHAGGPRAAAASSSSSA